MNIILGLTILALATARGTTLIVNDYITEPFRKAVQRRYGDESKLTYLVNCTYCTSVWVAAVAAATACLLLPISWWWVVPLTLAFSQVAVFAALLDR